MIRFFFPLILLLSFSQQDKNFAVQKSDSPKTATDSILDRWLDQQVVGSVFPSFKSLWFFVSKEELDSINSSRQLLRSFKLETAEQQRYYSWLMNEKFNQQAIAQVLRASEMLRTRDAWSSYWPLLNENSWTSLDDKNQLIHVELEDSALFVQFQPQEVYPFFVYDMKGNIVPIPQAIKRERHIAAVFLLTAAKEFAPGDFTPGKKRKLHRRSFFLVNEKMIRHWEHATPVMQDGIINELNYLLLLNAWTKDDPAHTAKAGRKSKNILEAWYHLSPEKRSIPQKIFACRRSSEPVDANGAEIDNAIATIRRIWPLQVKPADKYPSRGIR